MVTEGATIVEDANFPNFTTGWIPKNRLCSHVKFKEEMMNYLNPLAVNPHGLHNLDDIISFFKTHGEEEHYPKYSVATFEMVSSRAETSDSQEYKDALVTPFSMVTNGGVLGVLEKYGCDVLALPTESDKPTEIGGHPSINVPLGFCDTNTLSMYSNPNIADKGPQNP